MLQEREETDSVLRVGILADQSNRRHGAGTCPETDRQLISVIHGTGKLKAGACHWILFYTKWYTISHPRILFSQVHFNIIN
jgi:hypothetical protein